MERLKAFGVEKFTLDGRKFHTLTILYIQHSDNVTYDVRPLFICVVVILPVKIVVIQYNYMNL